MRSLTIIQHTRCRNRICRRSSVTIYRTKIAKKKKIREAIDKRPRLDAATGGAKWRYRVKFVVDRDPRVTSSSWKSFGGFGWMHLARSPSAFRIRD